MEQDNGEIIFLLPSIFTSNIIFELEIPSRMPWLLFSSRLVATPWSLVHNATNTLTPKPCRFLAYIGSIMVRIQKAVFYYRPR